MPGIILYYCPMAAMFWWLFLVLTVFEVRTVRSSPSSSAIIVVWLVLTCFFYLALFVLSSFFVIS
jgi:hypothetical protein